MATSFYFAYGSNMLSSRLRARCPSAVPRAAAMAHSHVVAFGKPSVDESGKAALLPLAGHIAHGVIFEIATKDLESLDEVEGPGYRREENFPVLCTHSGETIRASTYLAKQHDDRLKPYDWYLALILAGIAEHGLSDDYAAVFRAVGWERDVELERRSRREALTALEHAGIVDYERLLSKRA